MPKSVPVVRAMVAVTTMGTLVAVRAVRTHVWWHAALQLTVAVSIWGTEVRVDVTRHLVGRTTLAAAASTESADLAVLCGLDLFVNSVEEAAQRSGERVALLWWRARRTIRGTVRVLSRAVVRVVWWWWSERHREVVHHILVSRLDWEDEELAVFVSEKLDGDLVDSHRLVIEAEDLEVQRDDLVSVGRDDLRLWHLGAGATDAKRHTFGFIDFQLLDRARRWQLVHNPW
jgi:hypothetical protein